ncbi:zf-C2HC5-domain-containing protein [Tothia fuscella]|uniref:Zf-C2HC5-domain-containing protein n=1 Tax=Tothia fuscella TaxID=1048955 RepID=A0A9P4U2H9_9PEZI|nr:zf-C2HC5-domain-containing protein [Tothia fuscella]
MALEKWALPQLQKLLPLDEESLKQVIQYTQTLPKAQAAEHLGNLLGDSPAAFEFITTFNSRRQQPPSSTLAPSSNTSNQASASYSSVTQPQEDVTGVPKPKPRKKKANDFKKLPEPRRPEPFGDSSGGYVKRDEEDYISRTSQPKPKKQPHLSNTLSLNPTPELLALPNVRSTTTSPLPSRTASPKLPPSAAGRLISDSNPASRSASPSRGKTKITIAGGTPMHGQSTALNDLESAIRELEVQTNPSLASSAEENARRKCTCMAQRHALLDAAPNCLNCGKIICVKEGLGPCTFCNTPILSASEVQSMIRILREERGAEKQSANNAAHKRAEIAAKPRPFSASHLATPGLITPTSSNHNSDSESEKLSKAKQHRDKLLAFQSQNAKRTRVHDEAADFETPTSGQSVWATPAERALQLKKQQKILREQEWYSRPEWEKKRVVASIDLVGGKIVKRMQTMERPRTPESEEDDDDVVEGKDESVRTKGKGAFSRNPLLGGLIRPVAKVDKGKGREVPVERSTWRRVQDDKDDNEDMILDGGLQGGREDRILESEEPACG